MTPTRTFLSAKRLKGVRLPIVRAPPGWLSPYCTAIRCGVEGNAEQPAEGNRRRLLVKRAPRTSCQDERAWLASTKSRPDAPPSRESTLTFGLKRERETLLASGGNFVPLSRADSVGWVVRLSSLCSLRVAGAARAGKGD
jgi:hypothetical protein